MNQQLQPTRTFLVLVTLIFMLASQFCEAQTAYITNYDDSTVTVINLATNTVIDSITVGHGPLGVSVSPDGSKVYITNPVDNSVSVINTATNTVSATIIVGTSPAGVAVSPDGGKVYVANFYSNSVSVINAATNTLSATISIPVSGMPYGVAVSPDGSRVYVTNDSGSTVSVINTIADTVSATITVGSLPYGICVSPDGGKVYVANYNGNSVSVINTAADTVSASIPVEVIPRSISISPDGSEIYVTFTVNGSGSGDVSVINTASNTVSATIMALGGSYGISVSPDGSKVCVANANGTVSVINTATNTVSATIQVGHFPFAFGNFISTYTSPPTPVANFQSSDSSICAYDCISFINHSINSTSWQWSFPGAIDSTSTSRSPQNVCYAATGTYNVTLVAFNAAGSDTITFSNYITVHPAPTTPVITQSHDTLFCSTNASYISYKWYSDNTIINGATDTFFVFTHGGNYNVEVTNNNGCLIGAGTTVTGIDEFSAIDYISLYPNPASNTLTIHSSSFHNEAATVSVMNMLGEIVQEEKLKWSNDISINIKNLCAGIYFLQLKSEGGSVVRKFVKQ